MTNLREHPDIESAHRTGYGRYEQPKSHYCEECGTCLDDDTAYEDSAHDYLCKDCLLTLHERRWW